MVYGRRRMYWATTALLTGCATAAPTMHAGSGQADAPLARADLPLEAIGPAPQWAGRPTTRPATRPSIDALVAYAVGRDALARGDPPAALADLRRAAALDPDRFDVEYALGLALARSDAPTADAMDALARAAGQEPDRVDVWTELGRLYLSARQPSAAVTALRTAMLTTGYRGDDGAAAVVDLLLARALAADGYDRAALDRYAVLLRRFHDPALSVQDHPDLEGLTEHPDQLFEPIGRLYDRHGDWRTALQAYTAAGDAERFDLRVATAMDRARLGRAGDAAEADAAVRQAADGVVRDAASPPSVRLLADVCRELGRPDDQVDVLRQLAHTHPGDRSVLFAWTDLLVAAGRSDEAMVALRTAHERTPADAPVTRRLVAIDLEQGNPADAAASVVRTTTADPDTVGLLERSWDAIARRGGDDPVAATGGDPFSMPSRVFWSTRWAADRGEPLAREVDAAVGQGCQFPPLVRKWVDLTCSRPGITDVERVEACYREADKLWLHGLAVEVRGRALLAARRTVEATAVLDEAARQEGSPAAALPRAAAAHALVGRSPDEAYERDLAAIVARWPLDEDANVALFGYRVDPAVGALDRALAGLTAWRAADPDDVTARLLQARTDHQLGNVEAADRATDELLQRDGDDPDVLAATSAVYGDRRDVLVAKLEADHAAHPRSDGVTAELAAAYARAGRRADAVRVVDATRAADQDDADRLYPLANLYQMLGQPAAAEDVLQQVLRASGSHTGASNDLGYLWADAGRNLEAAERLIRSAVAAEPDNAAFLDSLGWVLYKRGRFAEACPVLERAAGPATAAADPAVLDHLGDALSGLGRRAEARDAWRRALSALGGDDQPTLRLRLQQKIRQVAASRSVEVPPPAANGG